MKINKSDLKKKKDIGATSLQQNQIRSEIFL